LSDTGVSPVLTGDARVTQKQFSSSPFAASFAPSRLPLGFDAKTQ
jgi:hypothetical protein